jgi:predicted membrane channel-forming protein YqfA (hemolysin III family)
LKYTLYLIFLFGIYGAGKLVYKEFAYGNICPKIVNIPACYIILVCLVIPLIIHLVKGSNSIYFMFTGLAWSIATYGSIMQVSGTIECPKTEEGSPMCYISFVMFSLLILLKVIELTKTNT